MHTISVMRNFLIEYRPAVHEGRENLQGLVFNYAVEVAEQFANRQNPSCEADTVCAGITARCIESGEWKRFRWDCILKMVANLATFFYLFACIQQKLLILFSLL